MSERGQKAYDYFMQGYNCAQAVLLAFSHKTGLKKNPAALVASGFGAGIGKTRNVCGTVTGMIMAADLINGYENPKDSNAKIHTYDMVQSLLNEFKAENGSIIKENAMKKIPRLFLINEQVNIIKNALALSFAGSQRKFLKII